MDKPDKTAPNPMDVHVGRRVRMRRKALELSQSDLANALGLTFQQIQKYEQGSNRISASRLFDMSRSLQVPVSYFFDGLPDVDSSAGLETTSSIYDTLLAATGGLELARAFVRMKPVLRKQIVALARELVRDDDGSVH